MSDQITVSGAGAILVAVVVGGFFAYKKMKKAPAAAPPSTVDQANVAVEMAPSPAPVRFSPPPSHAPPVSPTSPPFLSLVSLPSPP